MTTRTGILVLLVTAALIGPERGEAGGCRVSPQTVPSLSYRVRSTYPHDALAFTQGLYYLDGVLYEGTGLYGRSSIRKVDLVSGRVLEKRALPDRFFGEGITGFEGKLIQLTWQARRGFVYDQKSFEMEREFRYDTEGWGLTHDGRQLIMSNGSERLHFLDPVTFEKRAQIPVCSAGRPIVGLNELEWIDGYVYANVYTTDRIAVIDPDSGDVVAWLELAELLATASRYGRVGVLNGIAFDAERDALLVTGKNWPVLFEIELHGRPAKH